MATYYSNDLEWLLIRKGNSFTHKKLPEGPIFSTEPGNLTNIHSHKYSGLANSKAITVTATPTGSIQISTRKADSSPHAVKGARSTKSIKARSGGRKALGAASQHAKAGYRPDLRAPTLARVSRLIETQNEPKADPAKKLRGKKALALPV
ncbi:hypothetical protein PENSPDRAFT_642723 [Peniophora sp. CONT]|nr:hypothetical protein PENSPDRAFT_642723 [Peniophora sp. CONT]